jgi:hypothetical protein
MPTDGSADFYGLLNIPRDATADAVRSGYLAMSRQHHPDKVGGTSSEAFKDINRAYKILSEPTLREFYDKYGYEATLLAESGIDMDGLQETTLSRPDSKLKLLEEHVRTVLRSHEELTAQRFLQPSMTMVFGSRIMSYSPLYYSWGHASTNAGVLLYAGRYSVNVLQSAHVQRGGAAVSRTSLVFGIPISTHLSSRAMVHFMGGRWPAFDLMVQRQISDETTLRQNLVVDGASTLSTEWIQQLSNSVSGILALAVGSASGISLVLSKKLGGDILPRIRGKLRMGLSATTGLTVGSKVKYPLAEGLEVHFGPQVSLGTQTFSFEVAVQKEMPPVVEEQKGAFPTYLNWSLGLQYPDEVTVGLKLTRGPFSFHFPIELPAPESKWALVCLLALWTFSPLVVRMAKRVGDATQQRIEGVYE